MRSIGSYLRYQAIVQAEWVRCIHRIHGLFSLKLDRVLHRHFINSLLHLVSPVDPRLRALLKQDEALDELMVFLGYMLLNLTRLRLDKVDGLLHI